MSYSGSACDSQQESGVDCDDIRYARLWGLPTRTLVTERRAGGSWWAREPNRLESSIFLLPFPFSPGSPVWWDPRTAVAGAEGSVDAGQLLRDSELAQGVVRVERLGEA